MVIVDTDGAGTEVLVGMHDDFKAMTMHATALVTLRHIGQLVCRLKAVATPDMRMAGTVEVDPLMRRALHSDTADLRHVEPGSDPARDVLVGRLVDHGIQMQVIERLERVTHPLAQRRHLATRVSRPTGGKLRKRRGLEAVAMQGPAAVTIGQQIDMACRFEATGRHRHQERRHRGRDHAGPGSARNAA